MHFNSGFIHVVKKSQLHCAYTKEYLQNFQYIHTRAAISIRSTQEIIHTYE